MALAGDRCAAVWHPDGTFQFIADAFHVGAGCYPASEVFYREGFCRDLSGRVWLFWPARSLEYSCHIGFSRRCLAAHFCFLFWRQSVWFVPQILEKAVVQGSTASGHELACYQTSLDNFCLLLLTYLLLLLFRNVDREKVHAHIGRSLCSAAAGMVLYFLLTKLIVWACGWQMASYNGGADVSVLSILKNLPNAIAETYQLFGAYFFQNYYRHNILQPVGFFVLVFLALSIGLLNRFRKMLHRKNWEYILLGVAALIVLPIMCNAIMLITSEAVWLLQMGEGLNLFVPVCLLLLEGTRTNQPMVKKYVRAARTGAVVLAVLVVYGNVCSA